MSSIEAAATSDFLLLGAMYKFALLLYRTRYDTIEKRVDTVWCSAEDELIINIRATEVVDGNHL